MNFYSFHIGDYKTHTFHLSLLEDLAYRRMLDLYYTHETPLPANPEVIAIRIGMRDHVMEVASVLEQFFVDEPDCWRSPRCDEEIARMQDKQAKARESGLASARVQLPIPIPLPISLLRYAPERSASLESRSRRIFRTRYGGTSQPSAKPNDPRLQSHRLRSSNGKPRKPGSQQPKP